MFFALIIVLHPPSSPLPHLPPSSPAGLPCLNCSLPALRSHTWRGWRPHNHHPRTTHLPGATTTPTSPDPTPDSPLTFPGPFASRSLKPPLHSLLTLTSLRMQMESEESHRVTASGRPLHSELTPSRIVNFSLPTGSFPCIKSCTFVKTAYHEKAGPDPASFSLLTERRPLCPSLSLQPTLIKLSSLFSILRTPESLSGHLSPYPDLSNIWQSPPLLFKTIFPFASWAMTFQVFL